MQDQFLHPPVQDFRSVDLVLGRTGQFVDPAELLELLSGLSEDTEDLAIETELVDAAGIGVRAVQHLVWRRRDAQRPWRAGRKAAAALQIGAQVGLVADSRARIRIERNIDLDFALEGAVAIEHLDAPVVAIPDIDIALRIGGDGMHQVELARPLALLAPRLDPVAILVELG